MDLLIAELFCFLRRQALAKLRPNKSSATSLFRTTPCNVLNRTEFCLFLGHLRNHGDIQHGYRVYIDVYSLRSRSSSRAAHHEHRERETS